IIIQPRPYSTLFPYTTLFRSLGKYYLERHPDSTVKQELKYLLPDEIKAIDENQDITDYKLLDNAMGSGHILVYAFELFMKMYLRSEEHTSELQSRFDLVCRLL